MIYVTDIDQINIYLKEIIDIELVFANPPNSILYLGVSYIKTLIDIAKLENPSQNFIFICDCGDDGATSHEAMRIGIKHIKFTGNVELRNKLISIANKLNCKIYF